MMNEKIFKREMPSSIMLGLNDNTATPSSKQLRKYYYMYVCKKN